jgi:PAS domain-containing protein
VLRWIPGGRPAAAFWATLARICTRLLWRINLDIEERKKAELYLAEAQRLSHTGSWAWSPVLNAILYWSEECYRISGYDPAQGLPSFESSFQRVHPEDRSALTETIERAVREKATFQADYRQVLPDGTRRNVHIQANPVLQPYRFTVQCMRTRSWRWATHTRSRWVMYRS